MSALDVARRPLVVARARWDALPYDARKWIVVGGAGLLVGVFLFRQTAKKYAAQGYDVLRPGGPFPRYDFSDLHPEFRTDAEEWRARLLRRGIEIEVTSTFRTPLMQDALWAESRLTCAEVQDLRARAGMAWKSCDRISSTALTYAKGSDYDSWSLHQAGAAFDFKVKDPRTGQWYEDPRRTGTVPPEWQAAAEEAEAMGMTWGGRFQRPWDPVHLQAFSANKAPRYLVDAYLAGRLPETSLAQARSGLAGLDFIGAAFGGISGGVSESWFAC